MNEALVGLGLLVALVTAIALEIAVKEGYLAGRETFLYGLAGVAIVVGFGFGSWAVSAVFWWLLFRWF
jgi:hypothetical protein